MNAKLDELRRLAGRAENRKTETGIPRVAMVQGEIPEHLLATVYDPMVNLILTGSKTMAVTALSPLQYQKRIRLLHARSLQIVRGNR